MKAGTVSPRLDLSTDAAAFRLGLWELISDGPSRDLKSGSFRVGDSASPAVARAASWLNGTGTPAPEPGPIRKILTHLGEPLEPPPLSPARGPPTDWGEFVQVHDDRAIFQGRIDELPVIDIHSL